MPSSSVDGDDLHLLVADRSVGVTVCVIMCDAFKRLHKHDPGEQIFFICTHNNRCWFSSYVPADRSHRSIFNVIFNTSSSMNENRTFQRNITH